MIQPTTGLAQITDTSNGTAFLNPTNDTDLGAFSTTMCGSIPCGDVVDVLATVTLEWETSLANGTYLICPSTGSNWVDVESG